MCGVCCRRLRLSYDFIKQCEKTDKKLRAALANTEEQKRFITDNKENIDEHSTDIFSEQIHEIKQIPMNTKSDDIMYETYTEYDALVEEDTMSEPEEEVEFQYFVESSNDESVKKASCDYSDSTPNGLVESNLECSEEISATIFDPNNDNEAFDDFIVETVFEEGIEIEREENPIDTDDTISQASPSKQSLKAISRKIKVFTCNSCPQSFTSFNELNTHKKNHGEKRFQCTECPKRFSRQYRLKDHMLTHGEQIKLPCHLCDKTYTNRGNLERHIRHCHKKEKPHACEKCGVCFARKATLLTHYAAHSDVRTFKCDQCDKTFKTDYYLKVHKQSHIPVELRSHKRPKQKQKIQICICPHCGKKSTTLSLHVNHMRIHTGEKPFECTTCLKRFTFKQTLRTHMLMHSGEKPFVCDTCGMAFRQIGHLKGHTLAVHSGLKQHKCQSCGKCFALRSNLTIHERLHTGEKPYQCYICGKKFTDSNGLKRHKLSHERNGQMGPTMQEVVKHENNEAKTRGGSDSSQYSVHLDQLNVYLDELGNEFTEVIESETPVESAV